MRRALGSALVVLVACAAGAPIPPQWDQRSDVAPVETDRAVFRAPIARVKEAIEQELVQRGFKLLPASSPYRLVADQRKQPVSIGCGDVPAPNLTLCQAATLDCHMATRVNEVAITIEPEGEQTRVRVFVRAFEELDHMPPQCRPTMLGEHERIVALDSRSPAGMLLEAVQVALGERLMPGQK